ncbi:uncharacterized protein N7483_011468 [Penicillium malachiteum]|uniref:uncharacterized protein n=1 Tax=Penicillium malachiteum TaxID=1324776 RepID=UPI002546DB79|nr:uncharacterized protein N7483_011468 [Penicillium malachiteum]KAJ5714287.1 hypothetical protein N7483_011468 [Penicillium malachiteum]
MDEHTSSALHYGHVGRPIYLPETRTWSFERSFIRAPDLEYTGTTKTIIASPSRTAQATLFGPYGRPLNANSIPHALPELGVPWSSIDGHAASKLIARTNELYDPRASTLLDLGYALDVGKQNGIVSIAAAVTGESRNIISLRVIAEETTELPLDELSVKVPAIGDAEVTEWSTQGARIRQICFSQPAQDEEDKATWMAARLPESITIFRPLYLQDPAPMHLHHDDPALLPLSLRNSRLDANPVVEILSSHTGGFTHADIAFNPWYQRQIAILDTRGNWSLWEIQTKRHRRKADGLALPGRKGSLPSIDQEDVNAARHDGWGSIQWIVDYSTLIVADRRCVMIFRVEGDEVRTRAVELKLGRQSEWVLEVRRSVKNASQFYVLTTTRLILFDMRTAREDEEGVRLPLQYSLAWRHFRDTEDTSMRLSELSLRGGLYLILYSRLNELVQVYPCPVVNDTQTDPIEVSDPFLLYSSLGVHESLFKNLLSSSEELEMDDELDDRTVLRANEPHTLDTDWVDEDDDFVVNDWHESVMARRAAWKPGFPTSLAEDLSWTMNWTPVYKLALVNVLRGTNHLDDEEPRTTLNQIIEDVESGKLLELDDWQNSETMFEIAGGRPVSMDIEQNSIELKHLVSTVLPENTDAQPQFMIVPLRFSNLFPGMPIAHPERQSDLDFGYTYDRMVDEWLTKLSLEIPNQTRLMKGRTVRGIALDILLSRLIRISTDSTRLAASQFQENETPAKQEPTDSQDFDLGMASSQLASSQGTVVGHRSSQLRSGTKGALPSYSSLAAFTTFKPPRPQPRNVASLLSHWDLGADPSTYEWQKASQSQNAESSQMGPPGTPQRRARKKRSQQTLNVERPVQSLTPTAPTLRAWGSQPNHSMLVSSQPTVDDLPMTQTERGQFGTREVTKSSKAKKKRRAGGF